jgi:hypothetical protein
MKRKMSERGKLIWQDPGFQKKMREALNRKPNKLEKEFYTEVRKHIPSLKYVGDGTFTVEAKNPDFILAEGEEPTNCVDLFGDYWHKGEDPSERIELFRSEGYDLFVVWERDWRGHREEVIKRLITWAERV